MENNKKQIIVFGGCFNPPLNSHFSLAEQMIAEYPETIKFTLFTCRTNDSRISRNRENHICSSE